MPIVQYGGGMVMPHSIPRNFADGFCNLAFKTGAVPFAIDGLGFYVSPADPRSPLIVLDGSKRPAQVPGLSAKRSAKALESLTESSTGYVADWKLLEDLLDRLSPVQPASKTENDVPLRLRGILRYSIDPFRKPVEFAPRKPGGSRFLRRQATLPASDLQICKN